MTAVNARLVRSPDEISYHMIEAAHAALKLQRGDTEPVMSPMKPQKVAADVVMTPAVAAVAAPVPSAPVSSAGNIKDAVVAFLQKQSATKPEGIEFSLVTAQFKSSPESEVRTVLQKLVEDGDAYTTLDA